MTLIELILMMGMLAAVVSLAAPSLGRFFQGRSVREESRRFLALTRYAREQAISTGVRYEVWVDIDAGTYGANPIAGQEFEGSRAVEFNAVEGVVFEIDEEEADLQAEENEMEAEDSRPYIEFWPDGVIDGSSLTSVFIFDEDDVNDIFEIYQEDYGLGYVLTDDIELE